MAAVAPDEIPYTVRRSARARRVRVNVHAHSGVEVVLPAGASVAYETGARESRLHQQIWVQEGSIELTVGGLTHCLDADDCLAMPLNAPTAFRNRTHRPARYVVVVAAERAPAARR